MSPQLSNLLDTEAIQTLTDVLWRGSGISIAILAPGGSPVILSGWDDVCKVFHRRHSGLAKCCRESSSGLEQLLRDPSWRPGQLIEFVCKNGMPLVAVPIVMEEHYLGAMVMGQFFFEKPDEEFFARQAEKFGLDPRDYMQALGKIPLIPREQLARFANSVSLIIYLLTQKHVQTIKLLESETALKQQKKRLESILDAIPLPIFFKNRTGNYLGCNTAFEAMVKLPRAEVIGKTAFEIASRELADSNFQADQELFSRGGTQVYQASVLDADGMRRDVIFHKALFCDGSDSSNGLVGTMIDMTEQNLAEERLRAANRQLEDIIEFLPEATFVIDRERKVVAWNLAIERMTGVRKEEILGLGNYAYAVPFYGTQQPMLIDQVGCDIAELESSYRYLDIKKDCLSAERFTPALYGGRGAYLRAKASILFDQEGNCVGSIETIRDITEAKQAADALRQSEARFRMAFEAAQGMALIAIDGRILQVNESLCSLSGYEEKELLSTDFQSIIHPDDLESGLECIRRFNDGTSQNCQSVKRFFHKNGDIVWILLSTALVRDSYGKPLHIVSQVSDITVQKRAEMALQESEQKFRSIFEAAAAIIISPEGKFLQVNKTLCDFFGYTEEEMLGFTVDDITHPDDLQKTKKVYRDLSDGRWSFTHYEKRYLRQDGVTVWGRASLARVADPEGKALYFVGLLQDITEHKRSELELLASEKKYRSLSDEFQALLNGIPDPIVLLSPEMKIIWGNQGAAAHLGIPADRLPGCACYSVWHERSAPCDICPVVRTFQSGELEEEVIVTPDGRHWQTKGFPLKDKDGRVISVINMACDITEKIRMREDATRTSHLASLGALAAGVAHEINNPNGVILLNSDFLQKAFTEIQPLLEAQAQLDPDFTLGGIEYDEIAGEIPHLLAEVNESAQRIKRIVEDLKEYVQPIGVAKEPVDLNTAVQAASRLVANELKRSTDHFVTTYGENLPKIKGSLQAIEQVTINLLTNACQALPERTKGIFVATRFDQKNGVNILEVRDEGIGIAREDLPYITDPFFTTKRRTGGTGLGLAISSRIIEAHGGKIHFTSTPGAGTTITVVLPVGRLEDS